MIERALPKCSKELVLDDVAHERAFGAAHDIRNDEHPQRRNEDEDGTCGYTGHGKGQGHLAEGHAGRGTKIAGCFQEPFIHLFQGNIDGKHHKRKQGVDHAQKDGCVIIEQVERLFNESHVEEERIDKSLGTQDDDPRKGADQEVDPKRNHDEDDARLLPLFGQDHSNGVGYGVAHGKSKERCHEGRDEGRCKNRQVQRLEKASVVCERPVKDDLPVGGTGRKGHDHDDKEGQGKKEGQPSHGRDDKELSPLHFITFTASSAFHLMPTRSSAFHRFLSS